MNFKILVMLSMKNKNSNLIVSVMLFLCLSFGACRSISGSGPMITEARLVDEITSVDLEMNATVYLIQGDTQSLVIKAQQNILNVLKTTLNDGKLEIKTSEPVSVTEPIQLWITIKRIEDIELEGSGSIVSTTVFNSEKLLVDLSGSGKISLVLNNEKLEGDLSGSGDIYLKGKISKGIFDLSGSGNIYATESEMDNCKIDLNGSGTAKLNVLSELEASINGSGEVLYSGNPHKVKSEINGSGRIAKLE